ncbi:MAG: gephyrin-like molybdotransferase Glp [Arachnia sp.]
MALFGRKKTTPVEEETPEAPRLPEAPPVDEKGLRSVSDHTNYLLDLVEPLRPFGMSLLEAWDQVMCEDIDSMINVPPNSTSKIDGYAVRASDLVDVDGAKVDALELIDRGDRLDTGQAVAVHAGEVLPRGTSAVLPETFADVLQTRVSILDTVGAGDYIRAAGEHLALGTRLLSAGETLDDRAIGMLAASGIDKVLVRPRPRVVVVSSGSELVEPGSVLHYGESTDANSFMIAAAAKAAGSTVFRVAVHSNDPEELRQTITDQLIRADLVISTSGGRREEYEAVSGAMAELGLVDSVKVAMSPGRTQTFGLIGEDQVPMVMLPGNPVSAYVTFQVFVWPLIRRLRGAEPLRRPVRAIASNSMRSVKGQVHLLRGAVTTDGSIRHVERVSEPFAMAELTRSNALIVMDENTDHVAAGQPVQCWLLDD